MSSLSWGVSLTLIFPRANYKGSKTPNAHTWVAIPKLSYAKAPRWVAYQRFTNQDYIKGKGFIYVTFQIIEASWARTCSSKTPHTWATPSATFHLQTLDHRQPSVPSPRPHDHIIMTQQRSKDIPKATASPCWHQWQFHQQVWVSGKGMRTLPPGTGTHVT